MGSRGPDGLPSAVQRKGQIELHPPIAKRHYRDHLQGRGQGLKRWKVSERGNCRQSLGLGFMEAVGGMWGAEVVAVVAVAGSVVRLAGLRRSTQDWKQKSS